MKHKISQLLTTLVLASMLLTLAVGSTRSAKASDASLLNQSANTSDEIPPEKETSKEREAVSSQTPPTDYQARPALPGRQVQAATVLLIMDIYPWGSDAVQTLLFEMGIPYEQITSAAIASTNFNSYQLIIIPSDQSQTFYDTYNANLSKFNDFVTAGGVVEFHAAAQGWNGGSLDGIPLPGGVSVIEDSQDYNFFLDLSHPLAEGVANPFVGSSASHSHFESLLPDTEIVAVTGTDGSGMPTLIQYPYGEGTVVAAGQTLEFGYDNGQDSGILLENLLEYSILLAPNSFFVSPLHQEKLGAANDTLLYEFNIKNYSGITDTYALEANGIWPTELSITTTPQVEDNSSITFTVGITLPELDLGGIDDTLVTVTSVTTPTLSVTATLTSKVACTPSLHISGHSEETYGNLDDILEYGGQLFGYARISLYSDDNDSLNVRFAGFAQDNNGWVTLADEFDIGNIELFNDAFLPPQYSALRIELDDTEDNDLIYYDYDFYVCRTPAVAVAPKTQNGFVFSAGVTEIYTLTLTNYAMADAQFDLSIADNTWPTTLHDTNGDPISQTPLLSDLDVYTFTAQVQVPAEAVIGEMDSASIVAQADEIDGSATLSTYFARPGYVMDENNHIHILDTVSHQYTGKDIDVAMYGNQPLRGAISPNSEWLYVSLMDSDIVTIINTATQEITTSVPVGDGPHGIAYRSDGMYAFVANQYGDSVSVIDTQTQSVTVTIPVEDRPLSIASSPCLDQIYVTNRDSSSVSIIDATTLTVTHVITEGLSNPWGIVISPFGHVAYVTNQGADNIGVIDLSTNQIVANWSIPNANWINSLDITPDGLKLLVTDADIGVVYILNAFDGTLIKTLPGDLYNTITWYVEAFSENAGAFAYATNPDNGTISVLDTATDQAVSVIEIPTYSALRGLALFPESTTCRTGLVLSPVAPTQVARSGDTVSYVETLFNFGSTDSFNLSVSGNNWPTNISINNTGILTANESITFTVQVEIPADAVPGDSDVATILAEGNASTTSQATAQLTTSVIQPGYVFNAEDNTISIVDTNFHINTDITIDLSPYGSFPWRGALSPDGEWLFASLRNNNAVLAISTATYTPVYTIPVGSEPLGIAFSADSNWAFVTNADSDDVSVIDTTTMSVTVTIPVANEPFSIATSPCLNKAYVASRSGNTVSVIDTIAMTVTKEIAVAGAWDVVISPFGNRVYVSNSNDGSITVINTAGDTIEAVWELPSFQPQGLDLSPDGSILYISNTDNSWSYAINTATGDTTTTYGIDSTWEVEAFPWLKGPYAYFTNQWENRVAVINTDTNSIFGLIPVGAGPRGLALFPPESFCAAPPTAAFTPLQSLIIPGGTITFTNESIGPGQLLYTWDFGDGSPVSHESNPSHTYLDSGPHIVTLTVVNAYGTDTAEGSVVVKYLVSLPLTYRIYP